MIKALGSLPGTVKNADGLTGREIADALWLALQMGELEPVEPEEEAQPDSLDNDVNVSTVDPDHPPDGLDNTPEIRDEPVADLGIEPRPGGITLPERTMAIAVPDPSTIPDSLELARALRPLLQRIEVGTAEQLDEAATVDKIAETRICQPVLMPRTELRFDVALIFETSPSMALWQRFGRDLRRLLLRYGEFRDLRTWYLHHDGGQVWISPKADPDSFRRCHPRELLTGDRRRLVVVVSDCIDSPWFDGRMRDFLGIWTAHLPTVLFQVFPERLWERTGLNQTIQAAMSAKSDAIASDQLQAIALASRDRRYVAAERRVNAPIQLPIITADAEQLNTWARMMMGDPKARVPGGIWFPPVNQTDPASELPSVGARSQSPFETFWMTSSPLAKRLAGLLAVAPVVTLPIVRLIQRSMLPQSRAVHVAEVWMGGILTVRGDRLPTKANDPETERIIYQFVDDETRDRLGETEGQVHRLLVIDKTSQYVAQYFGLSLEEFSARLCLRDRSGLSDQEAEFFETFGELMAKDLRQMGDRYAQMADLIAPPPESGTGETTIPDDPWADIVLEEMEGVAIELVRDPFPLQSDEVEIVEIETVLDRFEFETATITRDGRSWDIQRSSGTAWGYIEPLGDEVGLDMVSIPGGTLIRRGNLLKATLQPFYLGRYAVTQAQWKVVAGYPEVKQTLAPDPSRFKGAQRPVERVRWDDAVEFCRRLSVATGKTYQLPSEAQWEYACRAGATTPFSFGETLTDELANYNANYSDNDGPRGKYRESTTTVGSFPANAWGLHDMHGNVWEWCEDGWHDGYEGAPRDGSAWIEEDRTEEPHRLLRGGSWYRHPRYCRSAVRADYQRVDRYDPLGFRVCCVPPRDF